MATLSDQTAVGSTHWAVVPEHSISDHSASERPLPYLFFEAEEESRLFEFRIVSDRQQLKQHERALRALAPLAFSLSDRSSVIDLGRNFHAAPPLRVVLGVFRI
ncbi:MAG: hypothetical protein R2818_14870 [Flavobacteriales bacterium]